MLRRDFLLAAAVAGLPGRAVATNALVPLSIRVASNQGAENATLQQLMADRRIADNLALSITVVESKEIAGPITALEQGRADICMISAFAGVLPAIEAGQPIRVIGTAMRVPALAVFSANPAVRHARDLIGRKVGIGERGGLLHLVMLALLQRNGIAAQQIEFVTIGSNAQVLQAVIAGKVDAGPSSVSGLSHGGIHVLREGELWRTLPQFAYQLAYASTEALQTRGEAVARCLAAYIRLFRFLSQPNSREPYLAAREKVGGDREEGEQAWRFIHRIQPYPQAPGLSASHIAYLQRLNVSAGLQRQVLPFDRIADLRPARAAARLL